jgi:hypothetical protein
MIIIVKIFDFFVAALFVLRGIDLDRGARVAGVDTEK